MALDPITALSVAAAVVQFVDFCRQIVCKSKELHGSIRGFTVEDQRSQSITLRLKRLAEDLKKEAGALGPEDDHQDLQAICTECGDVSVLLLSKLHNLKVPEDATQRRWKSFRQALKSVWKRGEIVRLASRLAELRSELDTHVLLSLRESMSRVSLEETQRFTTLDRQSRQIITKLVDNESKDIDFLEQFRALEQHHKAQFAELGLISARQNRLSQKVDSRAKQVIEELVSRYTTATTTIGQRFDALGDRLDELGSQLRDELRGYRENMVYEDGQRRLLRVQENLLQSLRFPEMEYRYEAIPEAHATTFSWIFADPSAHQKPWNSFIDWLAHGSGVYWIQGKPASGKSTLMKYIASQQYTMYHLATWAGDSRLIAGCFFFWNSGCKEQRSQAGLFRTLLYEFLKDHRDLLPKVFPEEWRKKSLFAANDLRIPEDEWSSLERLQKAFINLLQLAGPDLRLCFLIDGLDEYDGEADDVAQYVGEVATISPFAKFCISSRPWPAFVSAFKRYPGLKLQDLTEDDIKTYVYDKLEANEDMRELLEYEPDGARWLVSEITKRASGVFLWVYLVVKSLLRGIREGDDMACLYRRLCTLPIDIERLYAHLLEQIDPDHKEESSMIFQTFRASGNIMDVPGLQRVLRCLDHHSVMQLETIPIDKMRTEAFNKRSLWLYDKTILRLNSRCRGLLEVSSSRLEEDVTSHHNIRKLSDARTSSRDSFKAPRPPQAIQYLHRTARDYIEQPHVWQQLLNQTSSTKFNPFLALLIGAIVFVKQCPMLDVCRTAVGIYKHVANLRLGPSPATAALMRHLNQVLQFRLAEGEGANSIPDTAGDIPAVNYGEAAALEGSVSLVAIREVISWSIRNQHSHVLAVQHSELYPLPYQISLPEPPVPWLVYALSFPSLALMWPTTTMDEPSLRPFWLDALTFSSPDGMMPQDTKVFTNAVPDSLSLITPDIDLLRHLLQSGSNPNEELDENTVWEYTIYLVHIIDHKDEQCAISWLKAFTLMLEHGADPHASCIEDPVEAMKLREGRSLDEYSRMMRDHTLVRENSLRTCRTRRGRDNDSWDPKNLHSFHHSVAAVVQDVFEISGVPGTSELQALLKQRKDSVKSVKKRSRPKSDDDEGPRIHFPDWVS